MKRILIIMLALVLLLTGCINPGSNHLLKADNITIFYGVSSYAMFGAEQEIVTNLLYQFNSLNFEETTKPMDFASAFRVNFSYRGEGVKHFWVDKNGVFWLNGETKSYRASSGSFDYQYLQTVYEGSKSISWRQAEIGHVRDKARPLAKKWRELYDSPH